MVDTVSYNVPDPAVAEIIRPANSIAYVSGDAVSDVTGNKHFTFGSMFTESGNNSGTIERATFKTSIAPAATSDLMLWLFSSDIVVIADADPFTITTAELDTEICVLRFLDANWLSVAGGGAICTIDIPMVIKATSPHVYGQLVTGGAYTPGGNSEIVRIELTYSRDL